MTFFCFADGEKEYIDYEYGLDTIYRNEGFVLGEKNDFGSAIRHIDTIMEIMLIHEMNYNDLMSMSIEGVSCCDLADFYFHFSPKSVHVFDEYWQPVMNGIIQPDKIKWNPQFCENN